MSRTFSSAGMWLLLRNALSGAGDPRWRARKELKVVDMLVAKRREKAQKRGVCLLASRASTNTKLWSLCCHTFGVRILLTKRGDACLLVIGCIPLISLVSCVVVIGYSHRSARESLLESLDTKNLSALFGLAGSFWAFQACLAGLSSETAVPCGTGQKGPARHFQ